MFCKSVGIFSKKNHFLVKTHHTLPFSRFSQVDFFGTDLSFFDSTKWWFSKCDRLYRSFYWHFLCEKPFARWPSNGKMRKSAIRLILSWYSRESYAALGHFSFLNFFKLLAEIWKNKNNGLKEWKAISKKLEIWPYARSSTPALGHTFASLKIT